MAIFNSKLLVYQRVIVSIGIGSIGFDGYPYGGFLSLGGTPKSPLFNGILHDKASILGTPIYVNPHIKTHLGRTGATGQL